MIRKLLHLFRHEWKVDEEKINGHWWRFCLKCGARQIYVGLICGGMMKLRKGQSVVRLKKRIDQIIKVSLWDEKLLCGWTLMCKEPKDIMPYKNNVERPYSFCFINDEIHLNSKSDKAWEIEVLGSLIIKQ